MVIKLATTFDENAKYDYFTALMKAKPDPLLFALWYRLPNTLENVLLEKEDFLISKIKEAINDENNRKNIIKQVFVEIFKTLQTGFTEKQIEEIVENLDKFTNDFIVPLEKLKENDYLFEEYYGPTDAFKDIALQMLTSMVSIIVEQENKQAIEKAKNGEKGQKLKFIITQTSTSGDTGPAGGSGIEGKYFVANIIGFPENEATYSQKGQMIKLKQNVKALSMNTSFSKIQESMLKGNTEEFRNELKKIIENELKDILEKYDLEVEINAGSFNSVNPGRVDGQTIYHSYGILQAQAKNIVDKNEEFIEVIPSGNGGHMYSVLMARLQTGKKGPTVVTCNRNNMFYRIIEEGKFKKPASNTAIDEPSVSMIIEYPNNMIRLFAYAFGTKRAEQITNDFFANKEIIFSDEERKILKDKLQVYAVEVPGPEELETIGKIFKQTGKIVCPHTANAIKGLEIYREKTNDNRKAIISATASAWKFLAAVAAGLSFEETDDIEKLYKEYKKLEKSLEGVRKLLDIIKQKYEKYGQKFSMDLIPEDIRKIYENGYDNNEIFSPEQFQEQTLKFVKDTIAPMFKKQIEEIL